MSNMAKKVTQMAEKAWKEAQVNLGTGVMFNIARCNDIKEGFITGYLKAFSDMVEYQREKAQSDKSDEIKDGPVQ